MEMKLRIKAKRSELTVRRSLYTGRLADEVDSILLLRLSFLIKCCGCLVTLTVVVIESLIIRALIAAHLNAESFWW